MEADELPFLNENPSWPFASIEALRSCMRRGNTSGDRFLDYLLEGDYFAGKGVWINPSPGTMAAYDELVARNPALLSESPYQRDFRTDGIRLRGENKVIVDRIDAAPEEARQAVEDHRRAQHEGERPPRAVFVGGPAAKIAALLTSPEFDQGIRVDTTYVLDGAEQSNESGSASYEHVNHANALNAELDNTGFGILGGALKRALFGEPDARVALNVDYRKVDLWPAGLRLRDVPVYLSNELHGLVQAIRTRLGRPNDHTLSRLASKVSTAILSRIETRLGVSLRLDNADPRAVFLYFSRKNHRASLVDNHELSESIGLVIDRLTASKLSYFYGDSILDRVVSGDLFRDNGCIRHGFDRICMDAMEKAAIECRHRQRLTHIYLERRDQGPTRAVAIALEGVHSGRRHYLALDHLAVSLGPTATFHYGSSPSLLSRLADRMQLGLPVPYQTIATGLSAQLLFRITDEARAKRLPFTGMKQTHFVEIGRTTSHVVIKLTCGGVIGLPVYSRSYAISALASILTVLTPDCGLEFEDVICAWPCARGINGPNNGQVVRLADNAVARFGEGGTGMSKMGSNAQTMFDLVGLAWPLGAPARLEPAHYRHTIVDRRRRVMKRLGL